MLEIVSRDAWYALAPMREEPLVTPVQHVFVVNTHTKPCRRRVYCDGMVRRIQQFNINIQRKPDIRYSFIIGGDGSVYEGRGWAIKPELPKYYRSTFPSCLLIAYLGTYIVSDLPQNMAETSVQLVKLGIRDGFIAKDFEYHDITQSAEQSTTTKSDLI